MRTKNNEYSESWKNEKNNLQSKKKKIVSLWNTCLDTSSFMIRNMDLI